MRRSRVQIVIGGEAEPAEKKKSFRTPILHLQILPSSTLHPANHFNIPDRRGSARILAAQTIRLL